MPRPADACPAHVPLHVVRRGAGRAECFFGERDRAAFLRWLARYAARFECSVHAYVLMGNHVHLLATAAGAGGIAGLLDRLCARHDRYASERLGRASRLWEEGFEASAIHVRRHLWACMRYIELNPVRARLVRHPGAYRWSSYGANALGSEDALVTPHAFYCALGRSAEARREAYRRSFVAAASARPQRS
jgi:putative transposase